MTDHTRPVSDRALAASYARKSTVDFLGIDAQHDSNSKLAAVNGHTIPANPAFRFEDDGVSGALRDRSGLQTILQMAKDGAPFKYLYVKDLTRLGRFDDPAESIALILELRKAGIRIVREGRPVPSDVMTPQEMMTELIVEAVEAANATAERQNIIRRVTGGMVNRLRCGFYPGSAAPYGLDRWLVDAQTGALIERVPPGRRVRIPFGVFVLRPAEGVEATIVRRIFTETLEGVLPHEIASRLTEEGVRPPRDRATNHVPGPWRRITIRRILTNPAYMGEIRWRARRRPQGIPMADVTTANAETERGPVVARNLMPEPLIAPELWHAVQGRIKDRSPRPRSDADASPFLLTGILRCSECGSHLHGAMSTKQGRTRRAYYRHDYRRDEWAQCQHAHRYFRAETIEGAVRDAITPLLTGTALEEMMAEGLRGLSAATNEAAHEREALQLAEQCKRLAAALDSATMSMACAETATEREAHTRTAQHLGRELESAKVASAKLSARSSEITSAARRFESKRHDWLKPFELFSQATRQEQARLLSTLLESITVDIDSARLSLVLRGP